MSIKMIRRLILLMLLASPLALFAEGNGEVLWWEIDNFSNIKAEGSDLTAQEMDVNAARIRYESEDAIGYLPIYAVDGSGGVYPSMADGKGSAVYLPGGFFSALESTSSTSFNFVIELGNWTDGKWVSTSMESVAVYYDTLKAEQHIAEWLDTIPEYATPWTPTSFTVVPEPSSGVLLLVASAMLALRRRKMTENG